MRTELILLSFLLSVLSLEKVHPRRTRAFSSVFALLSLSLSFPLLLLINVCHYHVKLVVFSLTFLLSHFLSEPRSTRFFLVKLRRATFLWLVVAAAAALIFSNFSPVFRCAFSSSSPLQSFNCPRSFAGA